LSASAGGGKLARFERQSVWRMMGVGRSRGVLDLSKGCDDPGRSPDGSIRVSEIATGRGGEAQVALSRGTISALVRLTVKVVMRR
jgi:hypothetical protein